MKLKILLQDFSDAKLVDYALLAMLLMINLIVGLALFSFGNT